MSEANSTCCLLSVYGMRAKGVQAKVDPDVFFWAKNFAWFVAANGYICTRTGTRTITLHRILMDNPEGLDVDHLNGDKADNRRANLRAVTRQQNIRNNGPRRRANGGSRYKGVSWHKRGRKWCDQITVDRYRHYLGLFTTEEEAARVYDAAAVRHFGDHAWLNFPPPGHHEQARSHSKAGTLRE